MKQHQTPSAAKLGSVQSLTFGQQRFDYMDDIPGMYYKGFPFPK